MLVKNLNLPADLESDSWTLARSILTPWLLILPWSLILGLLFLETRAASLPDTYSLYPLVFGMVFLALPHGALDHLVPTRLGLKWGRQPFWLMLYLLAYVGVAAAYYALWLWQPALAFVGFLVATVLHWGQGDLRFLELFLGRKRGHWFDTWVTVLLRGALPILTPILAFPETAESLFKHMSAALGSSVAPPQLSAPLLSTALTFTLFALGCLYLLCALRLAADTQALVTEGLELVLLLILFSAVPAYVSVGVYFAFWHALRHLARLVMLRSQDRDALAAGRILPTLGRFSLDLLPITCAALALLAFLYALNAPRISSLEGFIALYLVLVSSLTKPHLIVVALMDTPLWQKP